jgi:branched-chain amino acid transport system permease protein
LKFLRLWVLLSLSAVYLVLIPFFCYDSFYLLSVITTCSMLSAVSMGVWVTFSLGLINIGQAAFCTIGAYTTAILATKIDLSFWLCLPISGLMAALIGVLIGSAILRLKGIYFAMVTLIFGEAVRLFFMNGGTITGGPSGIWGVPKPDALSIFGVTIVPEFQATSYLSFYFLAAFLLMAVLGMMWRLKRSRLGLLFKAIKQNDALALSVGINLAKYRIIAFGIACSLGGLGGAFVATYMSNIYPNTFTVWDSVNFLLYCFLGGLDYLLGPVTGTLVLAGAFESLRVLQQYQGVLYACVMLAAIMWLPNGILSLRLGKRRKLTPTCHTQTILGKASESSVLEKRIRGEKSVQ